MRKTIIRIETTLDKKQFFKSSRLSLSKGGKIRVSLFK